MRAACLIHVSTGPGRYRLPPAPRRRFLVPIRERIRRNTFWSCSRGTARKTTPRAIRSTPTANIPVIPSPPFLSNLSLSYQLPPHFARRRRLSLAFIRFFCYHKANGLLLQQKGGRHGGLSRSTAESGPVPRYGGQGAAVHAGLPGGAAAAVFQGGCDLSCRRPRHPPGGGAHWPGAGEPDQGRWPASGHGGDPPRRPLCRALAAPGRRACR